MYIDDFENKYETREEARKAFEEMFDERMADVEGFCEELFNFSDLVDLLVFLYDRDETIYDVLKKQYAKKIEDGKICYVEEHMFDLKEVDE